MCFFPHGNWMETRLNNLYYTYIQLAQQPAVDFMRVRYSAGPANRLWHALGPSLGQSQRLASGDGLYNYPRSPTATDRGHDRHRSWWQLTEFLCRQRGVQLEWYLGDQPGWFVDRPGVNVKQLISGIYCDTYWYTTLCFVMYMSWRELICDQYVYIPIY